MKYTREMEVAKKAAVLAGKAIMEIYETDDFGVEVKADNSKISIGLGIFQIHK